MRISIEPIHVYGLWNQSARQSSASCLKAETYVSELIRSHVRHALPYLESLVDTLTRRYDMAEIGFATMLDDYSSPDDVGANGLTVADVSAIMEAVWHEEIAYSELGAHQQLMIVSEARLAETRTTNELLSRIGIPTPGPGAGSRASNQRLPRRSSRMRNLTVRSDTITRRDSKTLFPTLGESTRHPDIDIECSLYSDHSQEQPSCALLAASWQLFRMNWLPGDLESGAAILTGSSHGCSLSWSVLPVSLISVEHAVRTILSHVGESMDDFLSRMSYMFLAENIHAKESCL